MKRNRTFIKFANWVLAGIISMLGFAGCLIYGLEEYGTPYADFTVKGTVVEKATKKPIKGIQVGYSYPYDTGFAPMYGPPPAPYASKAHVITDAQGAFTLTDRFYAGEYLTNASVPIIPVYVVDIDGATNGSFQPEYLEVDFSKVVPEDPDSWYGGKYTVTISVELTETEDK